MYGSVFSNIFFLMFYVFLIIYLVLFILGPRNSTKHAKSTITTDLIYKFALLHHAL